MAADKKELVLDLLARNKMGNETSGAARDLDKVGSAADKAGDKMDGLTTAATVAGKAADDLGDEARDAADRIGHLDREIRKLNQDIVIMSGEMAYAADKAARADFAKGIRKAQAEIRQLSGARNVLGGLIPQPSPQEVKPKARSLGLMFADEMSGAISSKLGKAGPLIPVLVGMAIAAAPVVGGALAAGIIGGGTGAGIIGGIALASKSPEVKAAAKDLGLFVYSDAAGMARQHFAKPTIAAMGEVKRGWAGMSGDIDRLLAASAKSMPTLVRGAVGFTQQVTKGLADLVEMAGGPVMEQISQGLGDTGREIRRLFDGLKDNGVDAAVAIRMVFSLLNGVIRVTGITINALTESFGFLAKVGAFGKDAQQEYIRMSANAKIAESSNEDVAVSLETVRSAGVTAAGGISKLVEMMGDLNEANRTLYGSNIDMAEALDRAKKTITENGEGLSLNTEKGRENRRALDEIAGAAGRQQEAYEKVHGAGTGLNRVIDQNRLGFIRQAMAAGYSEDAARDLANKMIGIPNVDRRVKVNGIPKAKADVASLTRMIYGVPSRTVYLSMRITGNGSAGQSAAAIRKNMEARASGGPVMRGVPYLVGEDGPEVVVPEAAGRVLSAASSRGFGRVGGQGTAPAGGGQGGGVVRIELVGPEEARVWFRKMVRTMNFIPSVVT